MASIALEPSDVRSPVKTVIKELHLVPEDNLKGVTIGIDEFRRKYCGGKASEWVRTFVFDKYPETNYVNGGWVINPRGGKKTIIFEYQAAAWMEEHKYELDWNAKVLK